MTIKEEYKARALRNGIMKTIFYICPSCAEIIESADYIDKCQSCHYQGELQERSTQERADLCQKETLHRKKNPSDDSNINLVDTTSFYERNNKAQSLAQETRQERIIRRITEKTKSVKASLALGIPAINWRIQNLLTDRGVLIIASPPKQYKSFVAVHAAISVSNGTEFLGAFTTQQSPVLYLDEENGEIVLLRRFQQMSQGHHEEINDQLLYTSYGMIKLDTPEGKAAITHLIEQYHPGMIVLDSMVRFMEGDEDKATEVRVIFESIRELLDKYTISFIILHHTRKGNDGRKKSIALEDLRGSSDFGAFADAIVTIEPKEQGFEFRVIANRHIGLQEVMPSYIEVVSDRQQGPVTFVNKGVTHTRKNRAMEALLAWWHKNGITQFRTGEAVAHLETVGLSKNAFHEAREQLLSNGSIAESRPGFFIIMPGTVAVEERM